MAYSTLKKLHYSQGETTAARLWEVRRASESALHWDFPVGNDQLFCLLVPEVVRNVERIYQEEKRTFALWAQLPGAARSHYVRSLLMDEVVATNAIEGVHSTRKQIAHALRDAGKKTRFKEVAQLYLTLSEEEASLPHTVEDIRTAYDRVTAGEIADGDALDGSLFRAGPVDIVNASQKVMHRGFTPESAIVHGLNTMLSTLHSDGLIDTLISHFMFESVHPFYDGNGRTGRYFLALALQRTLSTTTALSLSRTIQEEKTTYYKSFSEVEHPLNRGDGTPFLTSFLPLIIQAQEATYLDLRQRQEALHALSKRISELSSGVHSASEQQLYKALYLLGQAHLFGFDHTMLLRDVSTHMECTEATARRHLGELESRGLIGTTSKRPLRFILSTAGLKHLGIDNALADA
ncbi:Fic family protein [Corynebacterium pacaense]|uniref:Fic family protein n=1 Tax=Corynebacterium pacaense TaxID=1816684 RepID=UPI0009BBA2F1|nr:Fic family protein [Corynebacterium pacaense]